MREIKFRQAILNGLDGSFLYWHYWGFLWREGELVFVCPDLKEHTTLGSTENAWKHSQTYMGLKDKVGKDIYEGDLLSHDNIKSRFLPYTIKFGKHTDIAEAGCTTHSNLGFYAEDAEGGATGLLNEELMIDWSGFEVIGNICEGVDKLSQEEKEG